MNVAGTATYRQAWHSLDIAWRSLDPELPRLAKEAGFADADLKPLVPEDRIAEVQEAHVDLPQARVIRAVREQVEALPIIPGPELGAHLAAAGVPFERTYIDLDHANPGVEVWTSATENLRDVEAKLRVLFEDCTLSGCLLTTHHGHLRGMIFGALGGKRVMPLAMFRRYNEDDERPPTFGVGDDWGICSVYGWSGEHGEMWVSLLGTAALERAIAVLYLIDAANVDLVERAESRQVLRRARREGQQIALQVTVRPTRTGSARVSSEMKRDYSHRFEVRGHYRHVTHGPHVRDQSKLRACPRCGFCRREWCPPHVRGPEDKPLVPKRRVLASESAVAGAVAGGDGPLENPQQTSASVPSRRPNVSTRGRSSNPTDRSRHKAT